MIDAFEAVKAINGQREDAVVVSTMTPIRYWEQVSKRPELDLPIYGAMGKASSVALGLALARPDVKVLVLDGDGGLLMNLGSLVTIAGQRPSNLVHFVFEDGVCQTTGGQPLPGAGVFDLAGIARNAGFAESYRFDNLEDLVSELPGIIGRSGPVFVSLQIVHGQDVPAAAGPKTRQAMGRVMEALRKG